MSFHKVPRLADPRAREVYAERCAEAKRLCREIAKSIGKDNREAHRYPDNWGHAASMGAVCHILGLALSTLEGKE